MKTFVFAAVAALSLGLGVANATTTNQHPLNHKPNYYNWLAGGN
jgi:hypothetical protein